MAAKGNEAQLIARKIIMAKCSKYFEWASWDTEVNSVDYDTLDSCFQLINRAWTTYV